MTTVNYGSRNRIADANLRPVGYQQTDDLSTANAGVSVPAEARVALVQAIGNDISWRDDGTAASATAAGTDGGMLLASGNDFLYVGDLSKLSLIEAVAASTAYANISYYA